MLHSNSSCVESLLLSSLVTRQLSFSVLLSSGGHNHQSRILSGFLTADFSPSCTWWWCLSGCPINLQPLGYYVRSIIAFEDHNPLLLSTQLPTCTSYVSSSCGQEGHNPGHLLQVTVTVPPQAIALCLERGSEITVEGGRDVVRRVLGAVTYLAEGSSY